MNEERYTSVAVKKQTKGYRYYWYGVHKQVSKQNIKYVNIL